MFFSRVINTINKLLIFVCACGACSVKAIFGVKTDIDLKGLDVIKESAKILAKSVETFPTKQMAIAIIGFIAISQGLFCFAKGFTTFICGNTYRPDGKRAGNLYGFIQCLVGIGLSLAGALAALYSANVSHYLFGL